MSDTHPGWNLLTLKEHFEKLDEERDRRYMEVNIEREKAHKIKQEADDAALGLAREIQAYKDEKANQLREQINRERGHYASREDLESAMREIKATINPIIGTRRDGQTSTIGALVVVATLGLMAGALLVNYTHATQPIGALVPGQVGSQTIPIPPR